MISCKKSQIAVTDLFIALFAATILIIIVVLAWGRYATILAEDSEYDAMQITAFQTADLLVKSGGEPSNWEDEPEDADAIGLAGSDRNLSAAKIAALRGLSYANVSRSLGLEFYNFYMELNYLNGTNLFSYGRVPQDFVVNSRRLVLYENEKSAFELALWK